MRLMYCKNCKVKPKPLAFCGGVAIRHHCYREFIEDTEAEVINAWNKDNSPVESAKLVGNNDKKASDNNGKVEICPICNRSGRKMPKCKKCNDTGIIAYEKDGGYFGKKCSNGCTPPPVKLPPVS